MKTLEYAKMEELDIYNEIIKDAKCFQQEQGFVQWTDDYPNTDTIHEDIEHKRGFVFRVDGNIAGYVCVDFSGEPTYAEIDGAWRVEEPYAVIHRMALDRKYRGMGLASTVFDLIEEICKKNNFCYIRVDTDFPNKRMQRALKTNGYVECGVIKVRGCGRLAYDKFL